MSRTKVADESPELAPAESARAYRARMMESGLPFEPLLGSDAPNTTKTRILDTAITLFAERGFESCTMRDLAAAVGIKAPAIYNHYASKDLVLAEAMQQILGQFFATVVGTCLEDADVEDWLERIVRHHILFQVEHPRHAEANDALMNAPGIEHNLPKAVHRRIVRTQRDYIELIRATILVRQPKMDRQDALIAAFSITATGDRVASWYDPDGPMSSAEVADRHWDLVRRLVDVS